MRRTLVMAAGGALGLMALAGAGPAAASCATTGTIVGGVGGALIGGAVGRVPGAVIGGLGGAVVGHEIARSSCRHRYYRYDRYDHYRYYRRPAREAYEAPPPAPPPDLYYDPYGRPIRVAPGGYAAATGYGTPGYGPGPGACRYEVRQFYDPTGALQQRQVQVCNR